MLGKVGGLIGAYRHSDETLIENHNKIINQNSWIIDGNYSVCMAPRFDFATSVIWLDPSIYSSIFRYILRSIKNDHDRVGRLVGTQNDFSFWLIKWIAFNYPKNRVKYENLIKNNPNLLVLHIKSMRLLISSQLSNNHEKESLILRGIYSQHF